MQSKKVLMITLVFVMLIVDFLAFHDIFEPHTVRDWLTLTMSVLIMLYLISDRLLFGKNT